MPGPLHPAHMLVRWGLSSVLVLQEVVDPLGALAEVVAAELLRIQSLEMQLLKMAVRVVMAEQREITV